ncbi:hypothetical protein HK102_009523 [Quaeritorhiza haematococci]|nr:hypothetical protein HK102_009523 [Quaeritorhiza haematococci]
MAWTTEESLLLVQAVHSYGEDNWDAVSEALQRHPSVVTSSNNQRSPEFFSPQLCAAQFAHLRSTLDKDDNDTPRKDQAKKLNLERIRAVEVALEQEEEAFRTIVKDIEDIRSGKWDEKLQDIVEEDGSHGEAPVALASENDRKTRQEDGVTTMDVDNPSADAAGKASPDQKTIQVGRDRELDSSAAKAETKQEQEEKDTKGVAAGTFQDDVVKSAALHETSTNPSVLNEKRIENASGPETDERDGTVKGSKEERPSETASPQTTPATVETVDDLDMKAVETPGSVETQPKSEQELADDESSTPMEISKTALEESEENGGRLQSLEDEKQAQKGKAPHPAMKLPKINTKFGSRIGHLADEESPALTPDESASTEDRLLKKERKGAESGRKRKRGDSSVHEDEDEVSGAETSDGGSSHEKRRMVSREEERRKNWRKTSMMIWNKIADHRYGNLFMHPVKNTPGYADAVKHPMSLLMIKNRIRDAEITTTTEFHRDILLCFINAIMFNNEDSDIYHWAMEMKQCAEAEIRTLWYYDRDFVNRRKSATPDVPSTASSSHPQPSLPSSLSSSSSSIPSQSSSTIQSAPPESGVSEPTPVQSLIIPNASF